jgi:hypothetical protein
MNRISLLQKRIKWIEHYCRGNNTTRDDDLKQLKAKLADLLEQDATSDKLRSLPLFSCKIAGWKFVCSTCYDKVYLYACYCKKSEIQKVYEIDHLSKVT